MARPLAFRCVLVCADGAPSVFRCVGRMCAESPHSASGLTVRSGLMTMRTITRATRMRRGHAGLTLTSRGG